MTDSEEQALSILNLATILNVSPARLVRECRLPTPQLTEAQSLELARATPYPHDEIAQLFDHRREVSPLEAISTIALLATMAAAPHPSKEYASAIQAQGRKHYPIAPADG